MAAESSTILVTGGAGFIGSALVRHLLETPDTRIVTLDKLTYAADREALAELVAHPRHSFVQADICDAAAVSAALAEHRPWAVVHLAAETHVDRSIDGPDRFVQTNIVGTHRLIEALTEHWRALPEAERRRFRFVQASTDEVYGSAGPDGTVPEAAPYAPSSPYAATKAAADHLVRAWHRTYGLPVLIAHACNNYGPRQFPEKLLPLIVGKALRGEPLPLYGDGLNRRRWLFVEDQARALAAVLERGRLGESYNIAGDDELTNLLLVTGACALLDERAPRPDGRLHAEAIAFVEDRPGHDRRYAVDDRKARSELGWSPRVDLDTGLARTIEWYLARFRRHPEGESYSGERLGLAGSATARASTATR